MPIELDHVQARKVVIYWPKRSKYVLRTRGNKRRHQSVRLVSGTEAIEATIANAEHDQTAGAQIKSTDILRTHSTIILGTSSKKYSVKINCIILRIFAVGCQMDDTLSHRLVLKSRHCC